MREEMERLLMRRFSVHGILHFPVQLIQENKSRFSSTIYSYIKMFLEKRCKYSSLVEI